MSSCGTKLSNKADATVALLPFQQCIGVLRRCWPALQSGSALSMRSTLLLELLTLSLAVNGGVFASVELQKTAASSAWQVSRALDNRRPLIETPQHPKISSSESWSSPLHQSVLICSVPVLSGIANVSRPAQPGPRHHTQLS